MISMDWLSSSHRGIRAWEKNKKKTKREKCTSEIPYFKRKKKKKISHPHIRRQTWSKPWQLDTSLRTFSSAKSRDRSSSRSLFSRVNMSHLKPNARRWNSAWKHLQHFLVWLRLSFQLWEAGLMCWWTSFGFQVTPCIEHTALHCAHKLMFEQTALSEAYSCRLYKCK